METRDQLSTQGVPHIVSTSWGFSSAASSSSHCPHPPPVSPFVSVGGTEVCTSVKRDLLYRQKRPTPRMCADVNYLLSTTCVLAVNYMCTCCQLHVYLVSTTCVLAFNYMCTCCQLLVYLLSTTSVLAVNYLCVCVCLCVSVLHINITLWFVEGCVPVAVKGVPILLKRGWQC